MIKNLTRPDHIQVNIAGEHPEFSCLNCSTIIEWKEKFERKPMKDSNLREFYDRFLNEHKNCKPSIKQTK